MNLSKAKKLLSIDISQMSLEALQRQYVALLDAWRYAKGDYGHDNTFFAYCGEMRGFVPADYWLERNLATRLSEIEKILNKKQARNCACCENCRKVYYIFLLLDFQHCYSCIVPWNACK